MKFITDKVAEDGFKKEAKNKIYNVIKKWPAFVFFSDLGNKQKKGV